MADSPQPAARVDDQVQHSGASLGRILGAVGGAVLGAIAGAVLVTAAVAAAVATGGMAVPLIAAAVYVGAGCLFVGATGGAMSAFSNLGADVGAKFGSDVGKILTGVPTILIGRDKKLAAHIDSNVSCDRHKHTSGPPDAAPPDVKNPALEQVSQGSGTVLLGPARKAAARIGDGGTCGFKIGHGWSTVIIGGPQVGKAGDGDDPLKHAFDEIGKWSGLIAIAGAVLVEIPAGLAVAATAGLLSFGTAQAINLALLLLPAGMARDSAQAVLSVLPLTKLRTGGEEPGGLGPSLDERVTGPVKEAVKGKVENRPWPLGPYKKPPAGPAPDPPGGTPASGGDGGNTPAPSGGDGAPKTGGGGGDTTPPGGETGATEDGKPPIINVADTDPPAAKAPEDDAPQAARTPDPPPAEPLPPNQPAEAKATPEPAPPAAPRAQVRNVPLEGLRYSQGDVSPNFSDGRSIGEVADQMRQNGWDTTKPPPDMVEYPDGRTVTLDHRRLVAARQAGLSEVPANVHPADEPMSPSDAARFKLRKGADFTDPETQQDYQRGDTPRTWGEAAKFRSANQRAMGHPDFPVEGSPEVPAVRPPKPPSGGPGDEPPGGSKPPGGGSPEGGGKPPGGTDAPGGAAGETVPKPAEPVAPYQPESSRAAPEPPIRAVPPEPPVLARPPVLPELPLVEPLVIPEMIIPLASEAPPGGFDRGVSFFHERALPHMDKANATLGPKDGVAWFMPIDDAAGITSIPDAARATGNAPGPLAVAESLNTDQPARLYGLSIPTDNLPYRLPVEADAAGNPNWLEGGHTAVQVTNPDGSFTHEVNPEREFVVDGGGPMPPGTVLFEMNPDGSYAVPPVRRF